MSKNVRWQVTFASIKGVQYRVDIYDNNYSGTPEVLTGGSTPFVTDEDNSDDYFTPVRSQTGNLTVIDPDGTLMETLIPADNIDRPVNLIRVSDSAVMWKGYLSCEAYSQDYTARAQELTLNVNSILEAAKSVQLPIELASFCTIGALINDILLYMDEKYGRVSDYYLPINSINIVNKYIDTTVLFDLKKQDNENSVTYTVSGISIYEVLERICTYMGWTLRENGSKVYFMDADNTSGMRRFYYQAVLKPSGEVTRMYVGELNNTHTTTSLNMGNQEWRGIGHEKDVRQGAKSVEVVAEVKHYDLQLSIPDCPYGDLTRRFAYLPIFQQGSYTSEYYYGAQVLASTNTTAHTYIEFGYMSAIRPMSSSRGYTNPDSYEDSTLANVLNTMLINTSTTTGYTPTYYTAVKDNLTTRFHAGAFYGKISAWKEVVNYISGNKYDPESTVIEGTGLETKCTSPDPEDGIHMVFIPGAYSYGDVVSDPINNFDYSSTKPIFKMRTIIYHHLSGGYINLTASFLALYRNPLEDNQSNIVKHATSVNSQWSVGATLRFGNKYWNGTAWQSEPTQFRITFKGNNVKSNWSKEMSIDECNGLLIPVDDNMVGEIELQIWSDISKLSVGSSTDMIEMFFKSLDVTYKQSEDDMRTDRSENHYFKLMGMNFSDEVSVKTELASDLNNNPGPSILMDSETEPMTMLTYSDGTRERPEKHLLSRLATYYGAVRRKITLEIERPSTALPMVKVTGYDEKTYLPLSESRDWRTDTSTVTCFEMPS